MTKFINNHKNQSFFITSFLFSFILFSLVYSKNFLHIKHTNIKEDQFNLAITHFLHQAMPTPPSNTNEKIDKKQIEKEQKITNKQQKNTKKEKLLEKPLQKEVSIEKNQEIINTKQPTLQENIAPQEESISLNNNNNELLKEVKLAIDKALIYPRQAKKMRISGEIFLEFTWTKEKELKNLKIITPSKYKILNESALKTIQIASKNFPQYEKTFHIKIPIIYKIH
ncbi:energy transducer TonB [Campylobacter peloridis]|uniref:Energy transducer TonB n=1 Tax=Campylobacter peloridis TaxID=488546 RepID=A0ABX6TRX2_9BACT|nr:energy transducer TonB [Campylobacter peloridis]AJC84412.1 energy transduction protein TonB [Campylobacter peloridis LMG 23910]QOQ88507.1 energy transducer TonB [Campylobacter peloridis]